jgi:hypothetical protein
MGPPEQTTRQLADAAIGASAATLPFWALQAQSWLIFIGAAAGSILAVCRLVQFLVEVRRKRRDDGPR